MVRIWLLLKMCEGAGRRGYDIYPIIIIIKVQLGMKKVMHIYYIYITIDI